MADNSFYTTGGTLRPDSPSYVERRADRELVGALLQGDFCYVLDSRQKGKSSLMAKANTVLLAQGVSCAKLDLQKFGTNLDLERWYAGLLAALGRDLGLMKEVMSYWSNNQSVGALQRWVGAIETVILPAQNGKPLVVFVDELDYVRSLPFSTDEFFAGIREMYNRRAYDPIFRQITFCLLGVASPSDLIHDVQITPFNIGKRIELSDFTEEEASVLSNGLGARPKSDLKRILYWTGGHPFLTQKLCSEAVANSSISIDALVERFFLDSKARDDEQNLRDIARRITESTVPGQDQEGYRASILDLYQRVRNRPKRVRDSDTDPYIEILKLSGIVVVIDGVLASRNRIYERVFDNRWIKSNMPGAEIRRQRAAATRAFVRTAGVSLLMIGCLAVLTTLAIQSRTTAKEAEAVASKRAVELAASFNREQETTKQLKLALNNVRNASKRALVSEEKAKAAEKYANERADLATKAAEDANRARFDAQFATTQATNSMNHDQRATYVANIGIASRAIEGGDMGRGKALLDSMEESGTRKRGFDWRYVAGMLESVPFRSFSSPDNIVTYDATADNSRIASLCAWGRFRVDDVPSGRNLLSGQDLLATKIRISPNGRWVFTVTPSSFSLWNVEEREKVQTYPCDGWEHFGVSPDGQIIAETKPDGIRILNSGSGKVRQILVTPRLASYAFRPTGNGLAIGLGPRSLWLCKQNKTGKFVVSREVKSGFPVKAILFSPDGNYLACTGADSLAVFDWKGNEVYRLANSGQEISANSWVANWILSFNSSYYVDVRSRHYLSSTIAQTFGTISRWALSQNDNEMRASLPAQWSAERQSKRTFREHKESAVCFSPNGDKMGIFKAPGSLELLEFPSQKHLGSYELGEQVLEVVLGSGQTIFMLDDSGRLWKADLPNGKKVSNRRVDLPTGKKTLIWSGDLGANEVLTGHSLFAEHLGRLVVAHIQASRPLGTLGSVNRTCGLIFDNETRQPLSNSSSCINSASAVFGFLRDGRIVGEEDGAIFARTVEVESEPPLASKAHLPVVPRKVREAIWTTVSNGVVASLRPFANDRSEIELSFPLGEHRSVRMSIPWAEDAKHPSFSISSDLKYVSISTIRQAGIFSLTDGSLLWNLDSRWHGQNISTSPDGKLFACTAAIEDLRAKRTVPIGPERKNVITFPNEDLASEALVVGESGPSHGAQMAIVGSVSSDSIKTWSVPVDESIQRLTCLGSSKFTVAMSRSKTWIIQQSTGKVIATESGAICVPVESSQGEAIGVLKRDRLIVIRVRGQIRRSESAINVMMPVRGREAHRPTNFAISDDGGICAVGYGDGGTLILRDGEQGQWVPGRGIAVSSLAINFDRTLIAVGFENGEICLFDAKTGVFELPMVGHSCSVTKVAFNPDGETLASGDVQGTVKLWNVDVGIESIQIMDRFSPKGDRFGMPVRSTSACSALRFSNDSSHLGAGFEDGSTLDLYAPIESDLMAFRDQVRDWAPPTPMTDGGDLHVDYVLGSLATTMNPVDTEYLFDELKSLRNRVGKGKLSWRTQSPSLIVNLLRGGFEVECAEICRSILADSEGNLRTTKGRESLETAARVLGQLGDSSSVAAAFNFLQKRYRERKETEDLWSSLRIWRTSRLDKQTFGFLKSVIGLLASVDPTNSRSAVTPGVLLLRAGNTAGGLELLERNVESGSGSRIDHAYLALAQATAHRWEGVNEYFSKHTSYQMGSSSVEVYLVEAEIMQILKKAGRKIEPSKAASDQKFDSDPVGR